jgi:hypothetical protein
MEKKIRITAEQREEIIKGNKKLGRRLLCIAATGALLLVLLPSQKTLISMLVADKLTYNAAEKIIEAGKNLKDEIKGDVIDVFQNINEANVEAEETSE